MSEMRCIIGFLLNKRSQGIDWASALELANNLAEYFGTTYTEVNFILVNNGNSRQRILKYTPANLAKLEDLDPHQLSSVNFERFEGKKDYRQPEFSVGLLSATDSLEYPTRLKAIFNPGLLIHEFGNVVAHVVQKTAEAGFGLESGVAFAMEGDKQPLFFLSGIGTSGMTKEEEQVADALTLNIRDYRKKIWDVFCHNVVKKDLLRQSIVDEITSIVTPGNVTELGDKLIISLGDDCRGELELARREKLRKLFQREDLIMFRKY